MKRLEEIKIEIKSLLATDLSGFDEKKIEREAKKIGSRILVLKLCKNYLESNPSTEFISSEIERLENRISAIDLQFENSDYYNKNKSKNVNDKNKRLYEKELDVPKLRIQLRTLRFLLA